MTLHKGLTKIQALQYGEGILGIVTEVQGQAGRPPVSDVQRERQGRAPGRLSNSLTYLVGANIPRRAVDTQ